MNYPVCRTCKNNKSIDANICYGCGLHASLIGTFCNYKQKGSEKYTQKEYEKSFKK